MMLRRQILPLVLVALLASACSRPSTRPAAGAPPQAAEMRTIESVDPRPQMLEPPMMLLDEAPPPKPKVQPWETATPIVLSPEDEQFRASLPFSPAIAMDPVDGSKISMRANTPVFEFKGRIYYFSSEANKRAFVTSPEQYLTGRFTRL